MNKTDPEPLDRRSFLQTSALSLAAFALGPLGGESSLPGEEQPFLAGANYPWIAYGRDFGRNAWGDEGITSSGWTHQTYFDSQGITGVARSREKARSGAVSLRLQTDLIGGHPNKARGEVYLNLAVHASPAIAAPMNLVDTLVRCWVWFPAGSAGPETAPNGIELFFKSLWEPDGSWLSFYAPRQVIQPDWEENWIEFSANPSGPSGFQDPDFDATQVIATGIRLSTDDDSSSVLSDFVYLDDFEIGTAPEILFDFEQLTVERDFAALACEAQLIRFFVFGDGRTAPLFSNSGEVQNPGLDAHFFQDFEAILNAAQRQGLRLIPVLLDSLWCEPASLLNGVQLGGHAEVIRNTQKRQTYLDFALKPLLARYGDHASIFAWEIFSEPEGATEIPGGGWVGDPVSLQEMQTFISRCAQLVHQYTGQRTTLGSTRRDWLQIWTGQGIDVYQFHWYDHHTPTVPFPWEPYAALNLDAPCIIGEVPTDQSQFSTTAFLQAAQAGGYHGLLPWSFRARDPFSDFSQARGRLARRCSYLPLITR